VVEGEEIWGGVERKSTKLQGETPIPWYLATKKGVGKRDGTGFFAIYRDYPMTGMVLDMEKRTIRGGDPYQNPTV